MDDDVLEIKNKIKTLVNLGKNDTTEAMTIIKFLRNICGRGLRVQNIIMENEELHSVLRKIFDIDCEEDWPEDAQLKKMSFQLLSNLIVQNSNNQQLVWKRYGAMIVESSTDGPLNEYLNVQLMILYNIYIGNTQSLTDIEVLKIILKVWDNIHTQKYEKDIECLHFFFEHILVTAPMTTAKCYDKLQIKERISLLDYVLTYISHKNPNGSVDFKVLQTFSKKFKLKADTFLRVAQTNASDNHPREIYMLLKVIATTSGDEIYAPSYSKDHSLFISACYLLRIILDAGKSSEQNIFTPMSKLDEVATTSNISTDFENEVSYELKTLLVRTIANLLHENQQNQEYCIDVQLLPLLFECTNMDARNPLMKEWSIIAIRNACLGCTKAQDIIANLKQQSVEQNDSVVEFENEARSTYKCDFHE
ncbi:ataxin-10-like [Teleopsis dalmanni]|uniref:ataxin-10-like n=1 Tax=Teleopsis dalmanni TaxID=139649 RepID=UPI0018CDD3E2|nr:ataxin-10-like [Teleopsis dalmanni]